MIAFVSGILEYAHESGVVVDVGGVGMNVVVSGDTLSRLPAAGESVRLYTHTSVREDAIVLYGFLSREELSLFRQLIGVSGVGPKGAQSILSVLSPEDLVFAVATGDAKAISRAPGVGKKLAERLILELRDKVSNETLLGDAAGLIRADEPETPGEGAAAEAAAALAALGYGKSEAVRAVRAAIARAPEAEGSGTEALLKLALGELI